ncbi:MAG: family 43 glycosylhydrolase [Lachnospiraceae bacterium]|nr:family 43 glycosylhydrolase [Lachnospiraceae bacterium]
MNRNIIKTAGSALVMLLIGSQCAFGAQEPQFFPVSQDGFIGDTMPFADGDEMHIFYLNDQRNGTIGFHPWNQVSTADFVNFRDIGEVLPVVHNEYDRDLALGTGSVIKKDDVYYAFYTAHNGNIEPKEVIRMATSTDINANGWEKSREFMLNPPKGYELNDFRDPYVLFNESEGRYWMLLTARKDNHGVILYMKSDDLLDWTEPQILYKNETNRSNMECPTLISYNGFWYLSYSEQEPNRIVKYLVSESPGGPFESFDINYFDGAGFYAGRIEEFRGKLYIIGWTPSKANSTDSGSIDWAGNLVAHGLRQGANGQLFPVSIPERSGSCANKRVLGNFGLSSAGYQFKTMEPLKERMILKGKMRYDASANGYFGFGFNHAGAENNINVVFDINKNQIRFYHCPLKEAKVPESKVAYALRQHSEIDFELVVDDSVFVLYVNGEIALTARNYNGIQRNWSVFSNDCRVSGENFTVLY